MGQLDGKNAIITGAGTGIGKGIARAFAREGANLVIASRNKQALERTAKELRANQSTVLVVPTDITAEAQVVALFQRAVRELGRLDILVNNSGIFDGGPIEELTLETWQRSLDVNLTGVFLCTREAMRIMKPQGGGRIINIGSVAAQVPRENWAPYTTTKHAIVGLTKATALEGRAFGISCGCLHPGNVMTERKTAMGQTSFTQEAQMTPDDIAIAAVTMAALPPYMNMLEAIVLPLTQLYLGRG